MSKTNAAARPMMPCPRCAGTGELPSYGHICEGVCFRCGGRKVVPATTARPAAPRKVEIEPGVFAFAPEGKRPLFRLLDSVARFNRASNAFVVESIADETIAYMGGTDLRAMARAYNAGERWAA